MHARFSRVEHVPTAAFGDELAAMNLESGAYIAFNRTAAEIWKLLVTSQSLDALADTLSTRYPVERERCRREVEALLEQLVDMGVVERRDD